MVEFIIKPLDKSDVPDVLRVYLACEDFLALGPQATASPEMVGQDIHEAHSLKGIFSGIFTQQGRKDTETAMPLCGVLSHVPSGFEDQPDLAFILLLMISAPFRNRGLGHWVINWLESQLRQTGNITRIQTGVQANNPKALRFWKRLGYQIIGPARLLPDTTIAFPLEKTI